MSSSIGCYSSLIRRTLDYFSNFQVNGEPFDAGQYSFFGDLGDDGGLEDELGGLEVWQCFDPLFEVNNTPLR